MGAHLKCFYSASKSITHPLTLFTIFRHRWQACLWLVWNVVVVAGIAVVGIIAGIAAAAVVAAVIAAAASSPFPVAAREGENSGSPCQQRRKAGDHQLQVPLLRLVETQSRVETARAREQHTRARQQAAGETWAWAWATACTGDNRCRGPREAERRAGARARARGRGRLAQGTQLQLQRQPRPCLDPTPTLASRYASADTRE